MSRTTWKVMRLLTRFISHCATAVIRMVSAQAGRPASAGAAKSTLPGPTIRSTPRAGKNGRVKGGDHGHGSQDKGCTDGYPVRFNQGQDAADGGGVRFAEFLSFLLIVCGTPPPWKAGSGRSHGRPRSLCSSSAWRPIASGSTVIQHQNLIGTLYAKPHAGIR